MAKKAVGLLDHTERKQHYANYGIVYKGKYLAPIEFKNFCQRLGFIRDVIEEAKNMMFTYLVGWAKYPDWYDKQESVMAVFENDTDTYLMVANDEINMTPALLAASRIKEAKTTPDISAEVRAFSAKVNASRVLRSKPGRAFQTMLNFRGKKQLMEGSRYGCNLVFVDGPFGVYNEVWDTYSCSFYTYMGGLCMNMMHIGGTVILFLPESMLRTMVNVKGHQIYISKQQAIIDAFCAATSDGWPLK
eukprot:gene2138-2837_t